MVILFGELFTLVLRSLFSFYAFLGITLSLRQKPDYIMGFWPNNLAGRIMILSLSISIFLSLSLSIYIYM